MTVRTAAGSHTPDDPRAPHIPYDPLGHPDPLRAGDSAATETLLRAYVRETGTDVPATGQLLQLPLPASRLTLRAPVLYRSATGWHRFGEAHVVTAAPVAPSEASVPSRKGAPPEEAGTSEEASTLPADTALVAAALIRESTLGRDAPPHLGGDAVGRVLNSAARTAVHIARRRAERQAGASRTTV